MEYQEGLNWIHSQRKFGEKPGIERMKWLLQELGNPQENVKGIHVVGTNGKGSTVHYLQQIYTASGYEAGTFTSPYIMDFRERISINGEMISKDDLLFLIERVRPIAERLPLETPWEPATEFELITTMMFLYFGEIHPVDIAIVEAGIGGLYDSTNVFEPMALVCPSIGLDHQGILGHSYAEIAEQKVGALKTSVPFVYATDRKDVRAVFQERAQSLSAPTFELGVDFWYEDADKTFSFHAREHHLDKLQLSMPGQHQKANASLAIMTALLLKKDYPNVTELSIQLGLEKSKWLGRTEWIAPNVMIDGAHNQESVKALVDVLQQDYEDKTIHILFAAIAGKPMETMLTTLNQFDSLTVTTFSYPSSLSLREYPVAYKKVTSWQEWVKQAETAPSNELFIITGSLYFISEVRQQLLS